MTRTVARFFLAALLLVAGAAHLSILRRGFRIVVPDWATRLLRTDKDTIVVVSGAAELALGAALVALPREQRRVGVAVAALLVAVFPGNIHQWLTRAAAPALDTDARRFGRLFLQPLLVVWALWCTTPRAGARRG